MLQSRCGFLELQRTPIPLVLRSDPFRAEHAKGASRKASEQFRHSIQSEFGRHRRVPTWTTLLPIREGVESGHPGSPAYGLPSGRCCAPAFPPRHRLRRFLSVGGGPPAGWRVGAIAWRSRVRLRRGFPSIFGFIKSHWLHPLFSGRAAGRVSRGQPGPRDPGPKGHWRPLGIRPPGERIWLPFPHDPINLKPAESLTRGRRSVRCTGLRRAPACFPPPERSSR